MTRIADQTPSGNSVKHAIARGTAVFLLLAIVGCAGGMPRVPDSPEQILDAGDSYLERRKYFPAQELYRAFLERYPGHERSDYAQFQLAESYFGDEDYALAAVEYRILVTNYGYSDYVDDAYFKEAVSFVEMCPKADLDQTKCLEALEKFKRFVQVFSASPFVPEALEYTARIHAKLARKDFLTAMYYYEQKLFVSSLIYLTKVIENYPDNDYWCRALYYKAVILVDREEEEEAVPLLSRAVAYPKNIREKRLAERLLRQLNPRTR